MVTKPNPDRAFWEAVYRAVCAIAAAIKKRYLSESKNGRDQSDS
jgi:hypothetical protein